MGAVRITSGTARLLIYAGGFPAVGGVQKFIRELAVALHGRELEIRMICWGPRSLLLSDIERAGVRVTRVFWRWGCRFGWPDRLLLRLGRTAIAAADVVLVGHLQPWVQKEVVRLRKRTGKPSVVFVTPYRPAEQWQGLRAPTAVLNSFDVIVVQSLSFASDLRQLGYVGGIRVIPYIPPLCLSLKPLPPYPFRVGFLGRLVPDKNLRYLLQSFALVNRRMSSTLHLFGDGAERPHLQKLTARLGLMRSVFFHGPVQGAAVENAIDSCHFFVFSSLTEGQCLASLEILARGRAIVATPVGVFPDLLTTREFGSVAPLNDPPLFAEAVHNTACRIADGSLTPELVQRAYTAKFCREQILSDYAGLFQELTE